jgi:hypothetical protein
MLDIEAGETDAGAIQTHWTRGTNVTRGHIGGGGGLELPLAPGGVTPHAGGVTPPPGGASERAGEIHAPREHAPRPRTRTHGSSDRRRDLARHERGEWSGPNHDGQRTPPAHVARTRGHPVPRLAREHEGEWDTSPRAERPAAVTLAMADLTTAVDEVVATDLDALTEEQIKEQLRLLQRELNRLVAFRSKGTGTLETRAIRSAGTGRESRAVRPTRTWAEEELGLTPSEAKRSGQTGRQVSDDPEVEHAYAEGLVREEHVRVITETLRTLVGDQRADVRTHLLAAAPSCTPVALGRLARRLLAKADQEAAQAADDRRYARRYARVTQTPDGMLALNALLSGLDMEVAQTAVDAFRTPDAEDEHRTPEQRTADALVAALRASLDLGKAPTQHGVRPHLILVAELSDFAAEQGSGEGMWSGPLPIDEIRRMSHDASITRVLVDARSVPIEASEGKRNVTSGVWKALLARDRGCRWPGCQAPPAWCDAAHGPVPERDNGRLSPSNGVLLCRRHHRKVDNGGWTIDIRGPDISFLAPDGHRVRSPAPG